MANQGSSNSGKGKDVIMEEEEEEAAVDLPCITENIKDKKMQEIAMNDEAQLEFILKVGLVKDYSLSMPIRFQLGKDKWNLFLPVEELEETLISYLKVDEDVREGLQVNVYDKGGHEFQLILKKWVMRESNKSFYSLNKGWNSFCGIQELKNNDIIALRIFRNAITDKLSFLVTYQRMNKGI